MTIRRARDAGAKRPIRTLACLLLAVPMLASLPAAAAELRLLRADKAELRTTVLQQDALRLQLNFNGEQQQLELRPKTHLGELTRRLRNRAIAYEGELPGRPGSWVALTRAGNRWTGIWFDGQHYYGLASAAALASISIDAARAAPGNILVYRLSDAVWEDADFTGDTRTPGGDAESFIEKLGMELAAPDHALALLPTRRLSVALLADADLVRQDGADTETNMLAQLNIVDGIFANQVGVRLQSGSVTLFNSFTDPFTGTKVGGTLLDEVKTYRAGSSLQRNSGLTHLFTGRNLDGRTVGIAYLNSLCSSSFSASLSEASRDVSFAALIMAHEIGHVFGAPHDVEAGSACEIAPGGYLMASQLNGSRTFSDCSLGIIAAAIAPGQSGARCLVPAEAADATIQAPPDLSLALNRPTDVTISVQSLGNVSVNAVNLRITLPLSLTLVSADGPTASCSSNNNVVDCALGNIAPGDDPAVTLRLLATAAGNTTAQLRVTAANDALRSNDFASLLLVAAEGSDLVATASAEPRTLAPGASTTAIFTLANQGPANAVDARLTLEIPAGLTVTTMALENTRCIAVTSVGLDCGPDALLAGGIARVTLTLRAEVAGTFLINAAGNSSRPELEPASNLASLTLTVAVPTRPATGGGGGNGGGGGGSLPPAMLLGLAALWLARASRRPRAVQARAK
jgi:hypothetical protein